MRTHFLALGGLALLSIAAYAAASKLTVTVEEARVRKSKAFFSPAVATLKYKDTVEAGAPEDGWLPVRVEGAKGWLHQSAVASKSGRVRAGNWDGADEATQDEVTLAGKGFNAETEKMYRSGDAGDYAAVDAMEQRVIEEESLHKFMHAGKTLPGRSK